MKALIILTLSAGAMLVPISSQAAVIFGPTTVSSAANSGALIGTSPELPAGTTSVVITYTMTNDGDGGAGSPERWGTVSFNGTGLGQFDFFGATDYAALTRTTDTVGPGGGNHETFGDGSSDGVLNSGTVTSYPVTLTLSNLGATWASSDNVTIAYDIGGGTITGTGIDFDTAPVFRLHTQNTAHTVNDFTVDAIPEPGSAALAIVGVASMLVRRRR